MNLPDCPFSPADVEIVKKNLLNNIASANNVLTKPSNPPMAVMPGAVLAAPALPSNTFSQDYYFFWVRDGAITMQQIAHLYHMSSSPEEKTNLKNILVSYLAFVKKIQSEPELNGVNVLGEPKFNVDGTVWTGQWSRPQNDGAAYQAIALTHIANIFIEEGQQDFVLKNIYDPHDDSSLLKANLEYTAAQWQTNTVGPWEELFGQHFSVQIVQRAALMQGALLADKLNDSGAANYYREQAAHLADVLGHHWHTPLGYYTETFAEQDQRGGGIGSTVLMGLIYGRIDQVDDPFRLSSESVLSTAYYIRDAFNGLYQINVKNHMVGKRGSLIGRYSNDVYDGNHNQYGNPWFLTSHMMAAFYYMVAEDLLAGKKIPITFLVQQFFGQVAPAIELPLDKIIAREASFFKACVTALIEQGDQILAATKSHAVTYPDGSSLHMSEQIDRASGEERSAPDLSWSYATLLTAVQARARAIKLFQP